MSIQSGIFGLDKAKKGDFYKVGDFVSFLNFLGSKMKKWDFLIIHFLFTARRQNRPLNKKLQRAKLRAIFLITALPVFALKKAKKMTKRIWKIPLSKFAVLRSI